MTSGSGASRCTWRVSRVNGSRSRCRLDSTHGGPCETRRRANRLARISAISAHLVRSQEITKRLQCGPNPAVMTTTPRHLHYSSDRGSLGSGGCMNDKIRRLRAEIERRGGSGTFTDDIPDKALEDFLQQVLECPCCAKPKLKIGPYSASSLTRRQTKASKRGS